MHLFINFFFFRGKIFKNTPSTSGGIPDRNVDRRLYSNNSMMVVTNLVMVVVQKVVMVVNDDGVSLYI